MYNNIDIINTLTSTIARKSFFDNDFVSTLEKQIDTRNPNWLLDQVLLDFESEEIDYILMNRDIIKSSLNKANDAVNKARTLITAKNLFYVQNVVFFRNELEVTDDIRGRIVIHSNEDLY